MGVLGNFNPQLRNGLQCLLWAIGESVRGEAITTARHLQNLQLSSQQFNGIARATGVKMYGHHAYRHRGRNTFHQGLLRYIIDNATCKFCSVREQAQLAVLNNFFPQR